MSNYSFSNYLDKVLVQRKSIFCNNKTKEEIMKWQSKVIKKPLTNIHEDFHPLVCQMFKNLLGYLGEIKSSKQSLPHIKKLLGIAFSSIPEIKDEVYLHCWKQICGHNDETYNKAIKAWKALAIVASSIAPSSQLFYALLNQLLFEIKSNDDSNIVRHANFVFARLHRVFSRPRKHSPTNQEIQYIEQLNSIPVTISLFSGEEVIVPTESYTTMRELKELVLRKMNFNTDKALYYGIYEIRKKHNNIEEGFIEEDEILCDLLSIWEKDLEAAIKSRENIEFKLFLKEKIYHETTDEDSISFRYHQVAYDYLMGRFEIDTEKMIGFASLKLAIEFPDSSDSSQAFNALNSRLESYVPESEIDFNKEEICQRIMEIYINLTDKEGAKSMFVEKLQSNEFFGANVFEVKYSDKNQNYDLDYPEDLILSIKPNNISLYDLGKKKLCTYDYNMIINWGISSVYFVFVVPKEDDLILKFYLETPHTKTIQNIIETYVNLLCGKSENEVDKLIKESEKKFGNLVSYRDKA